MRDDDMTTPRAEWRKLTELRPGDRVARTTPRGPHSSTRRTLAHAHLTGNLGEIAVREVDTTDPVSLGVAWTIRNSALSMRRYRHDVQFLVIVSDDGQPLDTAADKPDHGYITDNEETSS